MVDKFLLKDHLFNPTKVSQIAGEIFTVYPKFDKKNFIADVIQKFPELELKARISWIMQCLKKYLPNDYRRTTNILLRALPPQNDPQLSDDDFGDFIYAPYAEYVAKNGCTENELEFSLKALREITMRFSAEDAIRYFINAFPKKTLKVLLLWTNDDHYHVRRLSSEGTRPKLPWSQKINIPVGTPIPLLENLFWDQTRFVARSVANHINDISKIDPDLAIDTLSRWKKSGKQLPKEMDYIVRHALRSLTKSGYPKALKLLGVSREVDICVQNLWVPTKVKMNTALELSLTIYANENANIIADYILHFQNKLGELNRRRVFKLKKFLLTKGESIVLTKRHVLREHMTTRKLFRGRHELEIQINGKSFGKKAFWIV